jgi:hypothetical protein
MSDREVGSLARFVTVPFVSMEIGWVRSVKSVTRSRRESFGSVSWRVETSFAGFSIRFGKAR